eukprot:6464161-Amphidinium_carterae.1
MEGARSELWPESKSLKRRHATDVPEAPPLQAQLERAQQHLEEGFLLRKAFAALGDSRLVTQIDTAIVKEMESKHPLQRQADIDAYKCLR